MGMQHRRRGNSEDDAEKSQDESCPQAETADQSKRAEVSKGGNGWISYLTM